MKITLKLFVVIMCLSMGLNAQNNLKFGHINSSTLLGIMPDRDSAQAELQRHSKKLTDRIEQMQVEFNNKYEDYLSNEETDSDLIKSAKEKELQDLQQRIQEFQTTAQQDYQQKESELLKPIIEKATKAIKDVGKENGFTYIFDLSIGSIIHYSSDSEDVLPLVKKKLGLE